MNILCKRIGKFLEDRKISTLLLHGGVLTLDTRSNTVKNFQQNPTKFQGFLKIKYWLLILAYLKC